MPPGQLSTRYLPFTVTTPAGTSSSAPQSTDLGVVNLVVVSILLRVPLGHAGLTGIRFDLSGVTILPYSSAPAWIIGDDLRDEYTVGYQVGSKLTAVTYNADVFDHTHYALIQVRDRTPDTPAPVDLLDPAALGA